MTSNCWNVLSRAKARSVKKAVLLLLILAGCSSSAPPGDQFGNTCYNKGFDPGTNLYINCVNDEQARYTQIQTEYR